MTINTGIIRAHLHLIPSLISARHSAWSNEWLQIILRGACQVAQSSKARFSISAFGLTSFDFGLICDQQLCTSCQHNWRDVAYSEETLPGIMKLKRSEAKLNPSASQLECYWCLSEIAYYLQEINTGDFKRSQTKTILSCSFVHGGSSPSRTYHDIFVHQDFLVFLVSKIESVTTTHTAKGQKLPRS